MSDFVVAITGASGAVYAVRLLETMLAAGRTAHLTISPAGAEVLRYELGRTVDLEGFDVSQLLDSPGGGSEAGRVLYHHHRDWSAGIASGSFPTAGMAICPCSMGTLASLAQGHSSNLIHRAAEVHLKERRKLVVVPRETPLNSIQLGNMKRLAEAGAVVLPAMPGFYQGAGSVDELVNFVVGRVCDQLGVPHELFRRWGM